MSFEPNQYTRECKLKTDEFRIRLAKNTEKEREMVWEGYKNAPENFFRSLTEITRDIVEMWYPVERAIDYSRTLPYNAFRIVDGEEQEYAGNVTLSFFTPNRFNHVSLLGISVLPKFQARGLGYRLMQLALDVARQKPGICRVELQVTAKNERAIRLYEKCGFLSEGVLRKRWIYPDHTFDDVLTMAILFSEKFDQLREERTDLEKEL